MLDASILFSAMGQAATDGNTQQQQLPSPNQQDVMRFEQLLNLDSTGKGDISQVDSPLLQHVAPPVENQDSNFKQAALNTISELDGSYSKILNERAHMPSFADFMAEKQASFETKSDMKSYPSVSLDAKDPQKATDEHLNKVGSILDSSFEYTAMQTRWSMNANMWMTKFTLISSAVNQVVKGFKTLFQTG